MAIRCCHVKLNGARCTMPAVNGNEFCFHHIQLRTVRKRKPIAPDYTKFVKAPFFSIRLPETYEDLVVISYLALDAFSRYSIDYKQFSTITRQLELVRRCMVSAEHHKKLQGRLDKESIVTDVRPDEDGDWIALPDSETSPEPRTTSQPAIEPVPVPASPDPAEPEPSPDPLPQASSVTEETALAEPIVLSTLDAAAEPQTAHFHTPARKLPATPLFPTLAKHAKISALFSNTCISEKTLLQPSARSAPPPPREGKRLNLDTARAVVVGRD